MWKLPVITFNGRFKALRDRHHYIGAENPKNVVEEQSGEQNAAGNNIIQMQ